MICIFLNSENLICRGMDILKCFRGSLQLQDNQSRLYVYTCQRVKYAIRMANCVDPDQTAPYKHSDLGLHCLLEQKYPNILVHCNPTDFDF